MSLLDFVVLIAAILGIATYGTWRTRHRDSLNAYLKGDATQGWATIGLSVMATQASAITFMSTPGQGFEDGLGFVQFYFGIPLALVIISAVFLPMYRRFNVYTAYEFLGHRFDGKTRLLGAGLFLLQRGLAAGITIYAPAIILSTMLGWRLDLTIVLAGIVAIVYTTAGGSQAVSLTQKWQMGVIFGGMLMALVILLIKLPASVTEALAVAGGFNKLHAVTFSLDVHQRYTLWSGLLGGLFLQLSYFGTDQSQVQRYISGTSLRESRLGLMFNAVCKIPMQFSILLLGVLVFVFYQFEQAPVCFNQATWQAAVSHDSTGKLRAVEQQFAAVHAEKERWLRAWLEAKRQGNQPAEAEARAQAVAAQRKSEALRAEARAGLHAANPLSEGKDSDYVFITFVLQHLPHGVIGLLIAVFFAAALSSKAAELNALASTSTVDFYRHLVRREATGAHYVAASKWFTIFWGLVALAFALFASLADNLIQAINIIGSLFYGVMLGLFLVAFFLRRVGGTAVFWAALAAQALVLACHFFLKIGYLWYNPIGCATCVVLSVILQSVLGDRQAVVPALPGAGPAADEVEGAK
ncbi:MAG TPA: sodium:solute symporter [Candidatus Acidoferrum sp.]|jgi:SSS family solute:Na+ symporter|nr:sodium:solute symporter [Candidatus Acidoferrum sp.]